MSHDSTIPSRLDPMQTVPAPLGGDTRSRPASAGSGALGKWLLIGAVAVAVFATARLLVH